MSAKVEGAGVGPGVGGGMLSEAEEMQMRASQTTDESLESTRRMMHLLEESKEAGIRTLVALDDQGEQLERVEQGMDQINADMREAEENLAGMEKCCGLCALPWQRPPKNRDLENTWKSNEDGKMVSNQPVRVTDERSGGMVHSGYIAKVTKDAREDEMEENMQQVSGFLSNLRNMAVDMNSEIETQNKTVARLAEKGESNNTRIRLAQERTDKLMK